MPTDAGEGEHRVYLITVDSTDRAPLAPNKHYLGVDAVAWFINKQSSWFTDRMASGTLDIKIAAGIEHYQAALGTFDLKGGARIAPVFDRAVLPDRNYRGGPITLGASLTAIKKDTVIAGLLKSAAAASLGVAAGMVQTATAAGPAQLLAAAGEELIGGVRKVLSDTGDKREPLFDFSGFEFSIQPDRILGPECYILLHRGAPLAGNAVSVRASGQLLLPFVEDEVLEDGAWLLLRLRRSGQYSGQREWYADARALRGRIEALVDDVQSGLVPADQGLQRLKPSGSGGETVGDEYVRLRAIIQNDGVLSEEEAKLHVGQLRLAITAGIKAIQQGRLEILRLELMEARSALLAGEPLPVETAALYDQEAAALAEIRRRAAAGPPQSAALLFDETAGESVPESAAAALAGAGAATATNMAGAIEESFRATR